MIINSILKGVGNGVAVLDGVYKTAEGVFAKISTKWGWDYKFRSENVAVDSDDLVLEDDDGTYEEEGERVSQPILIPAHTSSNIKWESTEPTDTDIKVYTGVSDSASKEPVKQPDSISDLELWLKADEGVYSDDGSTLAGNDDTVQEWHDQSGNGRNVEQATAGRRPTLKTNVFNGRPALHFDGDLMKTISGKQDTLTQPNTVFAVAKLDAVDDDFRFIFDGFDDTGRNTVGQFEGTQKWYFFAGTNVSTVDSTANKSIFSALFSGANSYLRINGSQDDGNAGTNSFKLITIGDRFALDITPWVGHIAEIIVYDKQLSSDEIAQVEGYLSDKYGIADLGNGYYTEATNDDSIDHLETDKYLWTKQVLSTDNTAATPKLESLRVEIK